MCTSLPRHRREQPHGLPGHPFSVGCIGVDLCLRWRVPIEDCHQLIHGRAVLGRQGCPPRPWSHTSFLCGQGPRCNAAHGEVLSAWVCVSFGPGSRPKGLGKNRKQVGGIGGSVGSRSGIRPAPVPACPFMGVRSDPGGRHGSAGPPPMAGAGRESAKTGETGVAEMSAVASDSLGRQTFPTDIMFRMGDDDQLASERRSVLREGR